MVLLSFLLTALVIYGIGRVLVRYLGWPTSRAAAARWCYALLASAIIFSGLPELLRVTTRALRPLPSVELVELVPELFVLGVALLGYVGWTRGSELRAEEARRDDQASTQVRRRALPPAPAEASPHEVGPSGFRPRGRVEHPVDDAPTGEE